MEYFTSPQDPESGSTACATKDMVSLVGEHPQKGLKSTTDLMALTKCDLIDSLFVNEKQIGERGSLPQQIEWICAGLEHAVTRVGYKRTDLFFWCHRNMIMGS